MFSKITFVLIAMLAIFAIHLLSPASAQCPTATNGNDTLTCTRGTGFTGLDGADSLTINGTVIGTIRGDGASGSGENDLIIIRVGSTVGVSINGDVGNDTIEFTNVDAAAQALIATCVTPSSCDIVIGANTYRVRNFETLRTVLIA